ncbi:MAG: response regulator [Spirochaetaceae bacterium]|nr:response regulator [Spirochaetaceae bacterium]
MHDTQADMHRILLVEDNDDHAELVSRCLEDRGKRLRIKRLGDGEAALAWLEAGAARPADDADWPPELILLDLRLPKIDGMEVLDRIKASEALRNIPVVILSSSAAAGDLEGAYSRHANSYVVKPLDAASLAAILDKLGCYWFDVNRRPALG